MSATNDNAPAPLPSQPENKLKGQKIELIRMILDFISKCFYPGIVIALIVFLLPKLNQVDMKALFSRLKSAKAGGYELTFSQAQDVGAETAPIDRKISELERTISFLKSDIGALQNKTGSVQISDADKKKREAIERQYQANSKYTILVFHRRESRKAGKTVTDMLLKAGFVSSDTETDFSELQEIQPTPGIIYLTYNSAGKQVLSDVKNRIEKLGLAAKAKTSPRPIDLRRGDLQILVF